MTTSDVGLARRALLAAALIESGTALLGYPDDPDAIFQRITAHSQSLETGDADAAAWALLNRPPVTIRGLVGLLIYTRAFEEAGGEWPAHGRTEHERDWLRELVRVALDVLTTARKLDS